MSRHCPTAPWPRKQERRSKAQQSRAGQVECPFYTARVLWSLNVPVDVHGTTTSWQRAQTADQISDQCTGPAGHFKTCFRFCKTLDERHETFARW
ncbi:hypothetical protein Mapa_013547 [Marchantia paleacea]|nr:hypothetical protein Mapa_013547 [Marchantia paleacea]